MLYICAQKTGSETLTKSKYTKLCFGMSLLHSKKYIEFIVINTSRSKLELRIIVARLLQRIYINMAIATSLHLKQLC